MGQDRESRPKLPRSKSLQDEAWIEVVRLATRIAELESQQQAALALKHFDALTAIKDELADAERQREQLLNDLAQSVVIG
jgi:hypothetical protein